MYISCLSAALGRNPGGHEYLLFSTGERRSIARDAYGLPVAALPGPRRPLQAAWCLADHPRVNGLRGRFDLLHVLVPSVPVPTDVPHVVTIHDLTPLQCPSFYQLSDRLLFWLAVHRAARKATRIIAISERTRQDVIRQLGASPERVRTIHYGTPPGFDRRPEPEVRRVVER